MADARTPHSSSFPTKGFKEVLRMRLEQKPQNYCEEEAPSQIKRTRIGKGTCSSLTFTELLTLKGKACLETDRSNEESDGKTSGTTPSTPMLSFSRGNCELPNLNLSLLPSPSFHTHQKTDQADQPQKQSPFHSFRPPRGRVSSPANDNAFMSPAQCKQQQCSQLTIFYGETMNVYNNVTAHMAKAIMVLASSGGHTKSASEASTPLTSTSSPGREICRPPATTSAGEIQPSVTLKTENLPLSRKKSLQRFLERRNDRLNERAPYPRLHQI